MLTAMKGKWQVHGSRDVYENEWTTVSLVDIEQPDGNRFEHHVVSQPNSKGAAAVLANVADKGVLLLWRHRFITDTWTWELPAGGIELTESAEQAAGREMLEETGWRPGRLKKLFSYQPMNGLIEHEYHVYTTNSATWEGPAVDQNEAADLAWIPVSKLTSLIEKGDISDGLTLTTILYALQFGTLKN